MGLESIMNLIAGRNCGIEAISSKL